MGDNANLIHVKKILVPIDVSQPSRKLANFAFHLANLEHAKLVILNVIEDVKQGGAIGLQAKYGNVKLVEGFKKTKEESARQLLKNIIQEQEVTSRTGIGNVTIEILYKDRGKSVAWLVTDYAKKNDTDLIVIGIRGQSKFRQFLEGNVANGVISNSSCPVLVVTR